MSFFEFGRVWLELTLAYFYNPICALIMILLLRVYTKVKIVRAILLACMVNGLTITLYAMLVSITGYEKILALRLNGLFAKYLLFLFAFNFIVQSFWMIMLNLHKYAHDSYLKRLIFITMLSNFVAIWGMILFIKYDVIR